MNKLMILISSLTFFLSTYLFAQNDANLTEIQQFLTLNKKLKIATPDGTAMVVEKTKKNGTVLTPQKFTSTFITQIALDAKYPKEYLVQINGSSWAYVSKGIINSNYQKIKEEALAIKKGAPESKEVVSTAPITVESAPKQNPAPMPAPKVEKPKVAAATPVVVQPKPASEEDKHNVQVYENVMDDSIESVEVSAAFSAPDPLAQDELEQLPDLENVDGPKEFNEDQENYYIIDTAIQGDYGEGKNKKSFTIPENSIIKIIKEPKQGEWAYSVQVVSLPNGSPAPTETFRTSANYLKISSGLIQKGELEDFKKSQKAEEESKENEKKEIENYSKGIQTPVTEAEAVTPTPEEMLGDLDKPQGSPLPTGENSCQDEVFKLPDPGKEAFETCTSKNNYFESKIPNLDGDTLRKIENTPLAACVREAAKETVVQKLVECRRSGKAYTEVRRTASGRPCVSKKYAEYLAHSFKQAALCSNLSERELFKISYHESRGQPGAVGSRSDAGMMQLMPPAVAEVDFALKHQYDGNKKNSNVITPHIASNLRATDGCENLAKPSNRMKVYKGKKGWVSGLCERAAFPENSPKKNLIYGGAYFSGIKKLIKSRLSSIVGMSDTEKDNLAFSLGLVMYNGGWPGIDAAFRAHLKKNSGVKSADSFMKSFRASYRSKFPAALKYQEKVEADFTRLKGRGQNACDQI